MTERPASEIPLSATEPSPFPGDAEDGDSTQPNPPPLSPHPDPPRLAGEGAAWEQAESQRLRSPLPEQLVLDLDGYEGPIHLLLSLAREQKVDLANISILALADQYLGFIAAQRQLRLEIAADYLVMAAWLAYLKSRLLLPQPRQEDDEADAEQMTAALGHRLKLLEAMQTAGRALMMRAQLGQDFYLRGAPEGLTAVPVPVWRL